MSWQQFCVGKLGMPLSSLKTKCIKTPKCCHMNRTCGRKRVEDKWILELPYEQNHESLFSPVKCHHYCKLFSLFHERAEPQIWYWNAWLSIFNFGFLYWLSISVTSSVFSPSNDIVQVDVLDSFWNLQGYSSCLCLILFNIL